MSARDAIASPTPVLPAAPIGRRRRAKPAIASVAMLGSAIASTVVPSRNTKSVSRAALALVEVEYE